VWLRVSALWGSGVELLAADGSRPARPLCSLGLGVAALRWSGSSATISVLEPSVGLVMSGGFSLELTLLQAGAHF
jgi:hypothetical protein